VTAALLVIVVVGGGVAAWAGWRLHSRPTDHPTARAAAVIGRPSTSASRATAPAPSTPPVGPTARPGAIPALPDGPTGPAHADPPAATTGPPPTSVTIPSIGVHSRLQALRREPDGELQTPSFWQVAGWYAGGVRPGDTGPAVIAGHVDSVSGPAVFYRLTQLRPGASVIVDRRGAAPLHFVVAGSREYPKRRFPTEAVYGPTPVPTLRLVTCTGDFDYAKRSYVDNLVVTAYLR
jgi:hypothetical protein